MNNLKKIHFGFAVNAQIAFWISLYIFMFYVSSVSMGLPTALSRASLILLCHLTNFYVVFSFFIPAFFEKKKYTEFVIATILLIVILTPFRLLLEKGFIIKPFSSQARKGIFGLVIFSEISISAFASLLRLAISSNETKRRMNEMEKLNLETELKFLKSQMSPHFLFNTINNVYALSLGKSDKAPEALLKLSGLLRYLLYECNHKVLFYKELEALQSYTELFQLRYEETLNISLQSTVTNNELIVEPMLLIPLLENAVKHSGIGIIKGSFINIELHESDGAIRAIIINSKSGMVINDEPGGIGLQNIRKRLSMINADDSALQIKETETNFEVTIKIPSA